MKCVRYAAAALLALASSVGLIASATAQTPSQPAPPMMQPSAKPTAKPAPLKPAATTQATAAREPDLAYGAYQRGYYVTAFAAATRRVEELNQSVKALSRGQAKPRKRAAGRAARKPARLARRTRRA